MTTFLLKLRLNAQIIFFSSSFLSDVTNVHTKFHVLVVSMVEKDCIS